IPHWLLEVDTQPEVGTEGYDAGARILFDFFKQELEPLLDERLLDPLGREIISSCLAGADVSAYQRLIALPDIDR
ncbi:MAG: DUF4914 family protein, partial [Thermoguttaceae bacterium]|nr:DUF4914 family protein [Thermoguttaceae bacterium]